MSDGLAALTAQREKARNSSRRVPPSRHAPKSAPDENTLGEEPGAQRRSRPSPPTAVLAEQSHQAQADTPRKFPSAMSSTSNTGDVDQPLMRATIYVDSVSDAWLEDIAVLGRRSRPRIDASRSAVVRMALERLRRDMTPEQITAELHARAQIAPKRPGRKRI